MIPPTDEQLVAAARAASRVAWTTLVTRYYPLLLRYLRLQTGDVELAADLAQDTFLAAFAHLDQLPTERPFAAWLYRIAQLRLCRARHRQACHPVVSLEPFLDGSDSAGLRLRQPGEFAEHVAERELILAALAELSPPLHEALLLNAEEGFTAAEVATTMGISQAAAERRISRAKAQFRARYTALLDEGDQLFHVGA